MIDAYLGKLYELHKRLCRTSVWIRPYRFIPDKDYYRMLFGSSGSARFCMRELSR